MRKDVVREVEKECITFKANRDVYGNVRTLVVNYKEGWFVGSGVNIGDFGEVRQIKIRDWQKMINNLRTLGFEEYSSIGRTR